VKLDLSAWASDEEVARMSPSEKKGSVWEGTEEGKGVDQGKYTAGYFNYGGETVPIRLVGRGMERFGGLGTWEFRIWRQRLA